MTIAVFDEDLGKDDFLGSTSIDIGMVQMNKTFLNQLTLGKETTKSETVKNNHNPEWDFKTTFDVDHNAPETIIIEVFDDDFGKDDSLGNNSLDVIAVKKNENNF